VDAQGLVDLALPVGDVGDHPHHCRRFGFGSGGGEQLVGLTEVVFGLCGPAAGDEVAGSFGDDPGLAERVSWFFALGFRLFHGPA
jgi:hypothetical protein